MRIACRRVLPVLESYAHQPSPRSLLVCRASDAVTGAADAAGPPTGEQPPVTFKVEVNYVEIDAIVTDAQGNFVRNLTKDDFQVVRGGQAADADDRLARRHPGRAVRSAALHDQADRARRPQQPQGVQRARLRARARRSQHAASRDRARVKAAARQFVERYLGANDIAAIVQTGGAKATAQEFTSSRERLLRAIDRFMGQKERSATLEQDRRLPPHAVMPARGRAARSERADARLQGAQHLHGAEERRRLHGRHPRPAEGGGLLQRGHRLRHLQSDQQQLRDRRSAQYGQDAIAAATRANVSFYAVDPRGLTGLDEAIEIAVAARRSDARPRHAVAAARAADRAGQPAHDRRRDRRVRRGQLATTSAQLRAHHPGQQQLLRARLLLDRHEARRPFRTLTSGSRSRACRSARARATSRRRAGRRRASRRLRRSPRRSRCATRSTVPMPVTGLGITAFAAPMAGATPNAESVGARHRRDRRPRAEVQAGRAALFATTSKSRSSRWTRAARSGTAPRTSRSSSCGPRPTISSSKNGVRMTRRLELPPGRYQLRIGARESVGGRSAR